MNAISSLPSESSVWWVFIHLIYRLYGLWLVLHVLYSQLWFIFCVNENMNIFETVYSFLPQCLQVVNTLYMDHGAWSRSTNQWISITSYTDCTRCSHVEAVRLPVVFLCLSGSSFLTLPCCSISLVVTILQPTPLLVLLFSCGISV